MPVIDIPDVGEVEFPDDMPAADITRQAKRLHLQAGMADARRTGAWSERALNVMGALERLPQELAPPTELEGAFPEGEGGFTVGPGDVLQDISRESGLAVANFAGRAVRPVGQALNKAGEVAGGVVQDVRLGNSMLPATSAAISGTETPPSPGGAVGAGLDTAGRMVPVVGGAMLLQAAGVPAPVAFAVPPAAATYAETGDVAASLQSGTVGMLVPGVANLGRQAAAKALGRVVNAGLLKAGANTGQKIVETVAAQGALQAFMEGMNLPAYLQMTPAERRDALVQNLVANSAFLMMDVPGIARTGQASATQERVGPAVKVGQVLERLVNDPGAVEALRGAADQFALEATSPRNAQREVPPAEPMANVPGEPTAVAEPFRGAEIPQSEIRNPQFPDRPAETIVPPTAPAAEAPKPAPEPAATTLFDPSVIPVTELPVAKLTLSEDVPNFKEEADPTTGVVRGQELSGKFERLGTAPIVVWERSDGRLEVITGRHRLDLARRSGEKTIPAQIVRESQGFTKEHALTFDAEANIRDGQGSTKDYAHYFRNSRQRLTEAEAQSRGLLSRAKGKAGFDLGFNATDDVYALFAGDKINEAQALAIVRAAPDNPAAQQIGARQALQGRPAEFIGNFVKAALSNSGGRAETIDLFGADDSAMKAMEEQAKRAAAAVKELTDQVRAVQGAARNPEAARKLGVNVEDPEGVRRRVDELKAELVRWEDWPLHPDLVARTKGVEAKPAEPFALGKPESIEEQKARLEAEAAAAAAARVKAEQAEKLATGASAPLIGSTGDIGQRDLLGGGDLFSDPAGPAPRRSSGMGDPMGAPIPTPPAATPPPGAPGTAVLFNARLPVTLPRTAKGSASIPEVMAAFENIITAAGGQTPIRVGRFNKKRARGIYKPREEVTRIDSADNIPTAMHEIGHASQKLLYGTAYARGLRGLPPAVKRELVALGKALYGATKPAAGYSGEGWAEFNRLFITTDDAARLAPATEKYFREKVLVDHPEYARAVMAARKVVDKYRAQGSIGRAQQQLVKAPGTLSRIVKTIRNNVDMAAQVDEFEPLWKLAKGYEERSGNVLAPAEDPFLLASWKRGTAGAVVETMVNDAMIDPWGNPFYGPGNMSLRQALAPIKGRGEDFALYLFGRRALERWGKNKNPGITKEDAQYLVQHFDSPEFQLAAANYYEWNRGLLEYVAAADPAMEGTMQAILNSSYDYAPLARVVDPKGATSAAAAARANPLMRMHGSGRQVKDIFESTLENAARLVSHAHRKMVLESIIKLSKREGMGFLVEEVPRSKVKVDVNFEKLRQQLEDAGVDTSAIDEGAILTYFDLADKPKGQDPIVVVKEADGLHWYHVAPGVYDILNGLDPVRLHPALDLLLGVPARAFRLGTTGLRPSFSLFTNPTRDLRTLLVQTQSSANPAELAASYFSAFGEVVRNGFGGQTSPHVQAFYRLGAQLGQPLGVDIRHTRRAARELFKGKVARVVTNPVDHLRDLLQITESAPRVAELKMIAKDVGWEPGRPMTPDQAVQIALAAKRATVDFSAAGRISRVMNQAIPFYNATIQGTRSFARAMRDNPARAILWGMATLTVPALLNWWRNKDEEWYRQLPWRERYLYDNIHDGENVWQIPRPPEWGNMFSVLPEAILDSWYQKDPRGATEALKHILATSNPLDYPVPLKIAKEQWQNRIEFFDRPIVPRSQIDLPPGEQRGPYTTRLGEWLGNAFPNTVSPRRFDAGVRSYFGGAVPDLLDAVGLGAVKRDRDWERSDLPVLGRMFRRGGEISGHNLALGDYYDLLTLYSARGQAMRQALADGRQPLNPLKAQEYAYWQLLEGLRPAFKAAAEVADHTNDLQARQSLYRDMAREAERVVKLRPK